MSGLWPRDLEDALAHPVEPVCPSSCPFCKLCPAHVQRGINALWVEGRFAKPQDCGYYDRMQNAIWGSYGLVVPGSADELLELVAERIALEKET